MLIGSIRSRVPFEALFGGKARGEASAHTMAAYALIQWEDGFIHIISLSQIITPRKPIDDYTPGEYIRAKYQGRIYRARISMIHGKVQDSDLRSCGSQKNSNVSTLIMLCYQVVYNILIPKLCLKFKTTCRR